VVLVAMEDEKKKEKEEILRQLQQKKELVFSDLDDLGFECPAEGCVMTVDVMERVMTYWPNSKQVRVVDSNGEARSLFFYVEDPEPHFSYEDMTSDSRIIISNPKNHFFMDGQIGMRIEQAPFIKVEPNPNYVASRHLDYAKAEKEAGTKHFKNSKYEQAIDRYAASIKHLEKVATIDECDSERKEVLQACYLNLAASFLHEKKLDQVVKNCLRSNEIKPTAKAYFRMAEAHRLSREPNSAIEAYRKALELDPQDKLIKKSLTELETEMKTQMETDKSLWGGMFKKDN
jgi:tetratricopeptide (TPR) repeat protein